VSQNHDKPCAKPFRGELDTAYLGWSDDVARNTDDKEVAKSLIEDDLRWHAGIGAPEDDCEGLLTRRHLAATCLTRECVATAAVGGEATIAFAQALEGLEC
jgi:hypothetical protein